MLTGLWHHPIVGGDHQQCGIDAGGTGHHGVHEAFVAGHIDEAQRDRRACAQRVCNRDIGIAQFNGDAARALFLQAIGLDAGQCPHQACLAMVDMSGGTDDHACRVLHWARKSASSAGSRQRRSSHNASSVICPSTGRGS
ncbi:hypothetical protein D3C73_1184720 [compost metagenome]